MNVNTKNEKSFAKQKKDHCLKTSLSAWKAKLDKALGGVLWPPKTGDRQFWATLGG
jgi:hypothetical protein